MLAMLEKMSTQMSGTWLIFVEILNLGSIYKFLYVTGNLSEIIVICTESGIWQPISFQCVFDPTAVNLKDGASFGKFLPLRCQTSLLDNAFSLGALSKRDKHKLKK